MTKKLLFVASSYEHIKNFHIPYLKEFQCLGWETHVVAAYLPEIVDGVDKTVCLPFRKQEFFWENFHTIFQLRRQIKREKYDLILAHTTLGAFITRVAVWFMPHRPKLIAVNHGYLFTGGMPMWKNILLLLAEIVMAPVTDLVLTMNRYDYEAARKYHFCRRIENVPGMGVDFSRFHQSTKEDGVELRRQYGIRDDQTVLIYAAEFSGRKSQATVITAMRHLPESVVLVLPGLGKLFDECKILAAHLGQRVIFPGYIDDLSPWYRMADIAVSSSRSEGLPFNLMEALYMGLPAVVSKVKGNEDLIQEGETGLLFPYDDAKACADKILYLLEHPTLMETMRIQGKRLVSAYELSKIVPRIMQAYDSVFHE